MDVIWSSVGSYPPHGDPSVVLLQLNNSLEDDLVNEMLEGREITGEGRPMVPLVWDPPLQEPCCLIPLSCDESSLIAHQLSKAAHILRHRHLFPGLQPETHPSLDPACTQGTAWYARHWRTQSTGCLSRQYVRFGKFPTSLRPHL